MKNPMHALKTIASVLLLGGVGLAQAALPIQHWTQPSGAGVWLVESPTVPMVDVRIEFDAGGRRDPAAQAGLASAGAAMLAKGIRAVGNDPALDENALGEAWADLGASFGGGDSGDQVSFSLRSLTYPDLLQRAVALAARQLGEPAYPADVWTRERERRVAALREANMRPATVAARTFKQAVYGSHPYGYDSNEQTLARIAVADLQAWHARSLRACRARVSIVGAVTRAQADALATQLLARLPAGTPAGACEPLPPVAEVPPLAAAVEKHLPFESAQAHVLIGQPGIKRADPDYFTLTVGNYILGGGGFVSRLTEEVREKRGLSYSVYSYFNPGLHAGAFTIGLQTRPDQAAQAVQVAREVLRRFVTEGPTPAELKAAKDNLIGGFALRLDNNRKLLDNVANIAAHGLPLNYLDTWTRQVDKVTVADIKAAFARTLQPERMVTVVVGGRP
jgi:zinc protease